MLRLTRFYRRNPSYTQAIIALSALLVLLALAWLPSTRLSHAASHKRQSLTFADRVAAQRALEAVYHQRRLWPKENPQPKPSLDEVLPDTAIHAKVADYLRQTAALASYWQRTLTPAELQAELERMARDTRQPDALRELWAALGNDPLLIAECLARPTLVERLVREEYATDARWHGAVRQRAEAELRQMDAQARQHARSGEYREIEWRRASSEADNPPSAIRHR